MPLIALGIVGLVMFLVVKLVMLTTIAFGLNPHDLADFCLVWATYGALAKFIAFASSGLTNDWEDETLSIFHLSILGPIAFFGVICSLGDTYLLYRMEQSREKKV